MGGEYEPDDHGGWSCDWCGQDFDWRMAEPAVMEDRVFVVGHVGYEFEETRTLTLCAGRANHP